MCVCVGGGVCVCVCVCVEGKRTCTRIEMKCSSKIHLYHWTRE